MKSPQIFSGLSVIASNRAHQRDEFGQEVFCNYGTHRGWNITPRIGIIVVMSEIVGGNLIRAECW